ncbi:MAG: NAD-dependent epimerase/dehydratase family protein, partial [Bacteroidota bacterium]
MKVLVTGASGFLGGRLSKYLAEKKYEVLAFSRNPKRKQEFETLGIAYTFKKPYEEASLRKALEGVHAIVHCAALSSPWGKFEEFYEANVGLTQRLLALAQQSGVKRFVNISSPSIYFDFQDKLAVKESDQLPESFVNEYAETKLMAEEWVLSQHGKGIETISLRPRAIIGAEDQVLFPRLMKAYDTGRLRIIGDGKNKADFTSVSNLVVAIESCLHIGAEACGESYNISNGSATEMWEEINYLIKGMGKKPINKKVPYPLAIGLAALLETKSKYLGGSEPTLTRYGAGVLAKSFSLDISKAREKLNYVPEMSTREALDEFLAWYKQQDE